MNKGIMILSLSLWCCWSQYGFQKSGCGFVVGFNADVQYPQAFIFEPGNKKVTWIDVARLKDCEMKEAK